MIRLGIVGCGAMGDYHARKFSALDGVVLTAGYDRDPERAAAFGERWNIPRRFSDREAFFAAGVCDAVSCALADAGHGPLAHQAAHHGLPLFLEKPMAMTATESALVLAAFREKGLPLGVNFSKRNAPAVVHARQLMAGSTLGKLREARFSYLQSWLVDDSWGIWHQD